MVKTGVMRAVYESINKGQVANRPERGRARSSGFALAAFSAFASLLGLLHGCDFFLNDHMTPPVSELLAEGAGEVNAPVASEQTFSVEIRVGLGCAHHKDICLHNEDSCKRVHKNLLDADAQEV